MRHARYLIERYDLIYVDWHNSESYIQANAELLEQVIRWLNEQKRRNGSGEGNVVLGQSMGGLVARYALLEMERRKERHDVSAYISHDSPHRGAHIPLGYLHALRACAVMMDRIGSLNRGAIPDVLHEFHKIQTIAHAPATRQMLRYYLNPSGSIDTQLYGELQGYFDRYGFPRGDGHRAFQKLAIANMPKQRSSSEGHYFKASGGIGDIFGITEMITNVAFPSWHSVWNFLMPIPGSTKVYGEFYASPAKSPHDKVCYLDITQKKKYLWTIPKRKNIVHYEGHHPSDHPLDYSWASTFGDNGKRKYKTKRNKVRLCADDVLTPKKLEEYQTTYARAMAGFGLERGLHGSQAKHRSNMAYYKELVKATKNKKAEEAQLKESVAQLEKKAGKLRIKDTLYSFFGNSELDKAEQRIETLEKEVEQAQYLSEKEKNDIRKEVVILEDRLKDKDRELLQQRKEAESL